MDGLPTAYGTLAMTARQQGPTLRVTLGPGLRKETALADEAPGAEWDPPTLLLSDDVLTAMHALDPDRRAAIVMRYLLDYTPGEIAELLEVPRGTVNSRLRRALDELAREMER